MPRGSAACRRIRQETLNGTTMQELRNTIERAWEDRAKLSPGSAPAKVGEAVARVLDDLDHGRLRVAEKIGGFSQKTPTGKIAALLFLPPPDKPPTKAA